VISLEACFPSLIRASPPPWGTGEAFLFTMNRKWQSGFGREVVLDAKLIGLHREVADRA
jgi:hypothetical protein